MWYDHHSAPLEKLHPAQTYTLSGAVCKTAHGFHSITIDSELFDALPQPNGTWKLTPHLPER